MENIIASTLFESISVEVVGGVFAGLILLALGWASPRAYKWLRQKRADSRDADASATAQTNEETLEVLRAQVIAVANARNIRLPEKWRHAGSATVVTYNEGDSIEFYRDFQAMKRDMNSGVASIQARMGSPDEPVSVWSDSRCESWLAKNAD